MLNNRDLTTLLAKIRMVRPPPHQLATFGTTTLNYIVVSPTAEPGVCRLREGTVVAERPKILTPDFLRQRFEGFGDLEESFGRAMEEHYGAPLRALEYLFKNELQGTHSENAA